MKKVIITLGLISAMAVSAIAQEETTKQRPERPDPAAIANNLVSEFDADGNGSLNKEELNKGLASMRENRPQGSRSPQTQRPQQGQRGQQAQRPQQGQRGQQAQRPQQGQRGQQAQRPQQDQRGERPDPADMFLKRNDKDENGELTAEELTAAFGNMGRGRSQAQAPQGRQRGTQAAPRAPKGNK